jgi:hypothetical protein
MPRIWRVIPGLVWRDHRDAISKAKRLTTFIGLTVSAVLGRLCLSLDKLIDRRSVDVQIREPVFIIGNARSGTTLLHRLMAGDTNRFVTFRMWELFCPALCQKRFVRWFVSRTEAFAPGVYSRLVEWESRQLSDLKRLNPVGINKTQEDELLLLPFFATPTLAVAFPYLQELTELEDFDGLPQDEKRAVLSLYRECVKRQLAFQGENRTFLSKNPTFVGKLRAVLDEFPDARIIYPKRDPMEAIPSLLAMLREAWKLMNFDEQEMIRASQAVVDGCIKDYRYAPEVLSTLPADRFIVVKFEEFTSDPANAIRGIYEHFGWPVSDEYDHWLTQESPKPDPSRASRRRRLEDLGIDQASVEAKIASLATNR